MRKELGILVLFWGLVSGLFAQTFHPDYLDGNVYLKVKDSSAVVLAPYNNSIPSLNLLITSFGIDSIYKPFRTNDPTLDKIYRMEFTSVLGADNLISGLQALNFVEFAEKVPLIQTTGTTYLPNDLQANQWALTKVQAPLAWDISQGSASVVVAVVDNAFLTTHEDLQSTYFINTGEIPGNFFDDDLNGYIDDYKGYDVADMNADVNPPLTGSGWDHGTHCAGIVGASTDNGIGIASIGFGLTILPVKASADATGGNTLEKAYESVDYAVSMGADVISMSWGSKGQSLTGELLLNVAKNRNIVLIAAAGNNNDSIPFYPAAYPSVLAVGSTDQLDMRSGFSNFGSYIDVMAPGTDINSCLADANNSYGNLSGTSMACPLVAGLAGLILSNGTFTEAQVKQLIIDGCVNIDALNPAYIGKMGAGRINAFNSLNLATASAQPESGLHAQFFPNPVQDQAKLILDPSQLPIQMKLYDLTGRACLSRTVHTQTETLDFSDFQAGSYFLRLSNAEGSLTQIVRKF